MLTVRRLVAGAFSLLLLGISYTLLAQSSYEVTITNNQFTSKNGQTIPASVIHQFKNDAARLMLRNYDDPEDQSIRISPAQLQPYYSILTKLYLQDEQVIDIINCKVKTPPNPSTDYIQLIFDRTVSWASPLRAGVSSTKSSIINRYINRYDLIIAKHESFDARRDAITIRSAQPINMAALATQLYEVEGIEEINLGTTRSQTSNIIVRSNEQGWEVQFILYFEEEGVHQQHIWYYQVLENGKVQFLSESGAPIPEWMQCY